MSITKLAEQSNNLLMIFCVCHNCGLNEKMFTLDNKIFNKIILPFLRHPFLLHHLRRKRLHLRHPFVLRIFDTCTGSYSFRVVLSDVSGDFLIACIRPNMRYRFLHLLEQPMEQIRDKLLLCEKRKENDMLILKLPPCMLRVAIR